MSPNHVGDTLGAVLVGSGFAAVFVISFLPPEVATGLMPKDRRT